MHPDLTGRVAVVIAVVASGSCTPQGPTDLGPAVLAIYLGNDTNLAGLVNLRSGAVLVFGTEVSTEGITPRDAIRRASVDVGTGGGLVPAPSLGKGAYLTGLANAQQLAPSGEVVVFFETDGDTLALSGPTPPVLPLPFATLSGPTEEELPIQLPPRWWTSYPQVITQVLDLNGRVMWTDRPTTLDVWIDRIANPPQPRQVVVPAGTLEPGNYVIASAFLDQMDPEVTYIGPINEPFSGLWAGTARLVPLEVTD